MGHPQRAVQDHLWPGLPRWEPAAAALQAPPLVHPEQALAVPLCRSSPGPAGPPAPSQPLERSGLAPGCAARRGGPGPDCCVAKAAQFVILSLCVGPSRKTRASPDWLGLAHPGPSGSTVARMADHPNLGLEGREGETLALRGLSGAGAELQLLLPLLLQPQGQVVSPGSPRGSTCWWHLSRATSPRSPGLALPLGLGLSPPCANSQPGLWRAGEGVCPAPHSNQRPRALAREKGDQAEQDPAGMQTET